MNRVYKIKKELKIPMVIAAVLAIPVFADLIWGRTVQPSMLVTAFVLMIVFYVLTINNLMRKLTITDAEIAIRSLGGVRRIPTHDITLVDGVTMGAKQFVTVSGNKKHSFITNSFERFPELVADVESVVKEEALGEGFKALKENIVPRKSDVTAAWLTVTVLIIVISLVIYQK
jgi:hypothetical protein